MNRSFAAILLLLFPLPCAAQNAASRPDLHAGGVSPSMIANGAITEVVLPGRHLAGAKVDSGHQCRVVSSTVSETLIRMKIQGTRTVDDAEDQCTLTVHTPAGHASTWIVVELTEAEQRERAARRKSEGEAKTQAFWDRAGKVWHLRFAGGDTVTYKTTGHDADGNATIIEPGCMRSGKLEGGKVQEGARWEIARRQDSGPRRRNSKGSPVLP